MEKIDITALGPMPQITYCDEQIGNATVSVKNKISYEEILEITQWAIALIVGERTFVSAPLEELVMDYLIIDAYSNLDLSFLKQGVTSGEELYADYDILKSHNAPQLIKQHIDTDQLQFIYTTVDKTLQSIVNYRNSAAGMIETLASNAGENSEVFQQALDILGNEEKLKEVKSFLNKVEDAKQPIME